MVVGLVAGPFPRHRGPKEIAAKDKTASSSRGNQIPRMGTTEQRATPRHMGSLCFLVDFVLLLGVFWMLCVISIIFRHLVFGIWHPVHFSQRRGGVEKGDWWFGGQVFGVVSAFLNNHCWRKGECTREREMSKVMTMNDKPSYPH